MHQSRKFTSSKTNLKSSEHISRHDRISYKLPTIFFSSQKVSHLGLFNPNFGGVLGFCFGGHISSLFFFIFFSKGLPSSSTFTLEEGTIYLTSEPNAVEMQDDNASVLDVYLVSNFQFLPLPFWSTDGSMAYTRTSSSRSGVLGC